MKNLLLFCLALVMATSLRAQGNFFSPANDKQLPDLGNTRLFRTDKAWISEVTDHKELAAHLALAPHEDATSAKNGMLIELPNPEGEATSFRIVRYTMIHPSVQALMPNAVTAYGIDTEGKGLRLSLSYTSAGISAMVRGGRNGRWMIDPVFAGNPQFHQSFYTKDSPATVARQCLVEDDVFNNIDRGEPLEEKILDDCRLRTHELAMACTGEYFQYMVTEYGGSGNDYVTVFERIMVSINRVNQIFREDIALTFVLVNQAEADTIQLLYNNPAEDPYDNASTSQMANVNSSVINSVIGEANYNLGHVFSTGTGGLAGPGICFAGRQGFGASGIPQPETDIFDVNFVAHELGHQLGARHTFNSQELNCGGGARSPGSAFEPGSGTTIMAYAGICAPDNIQQNSDPYFHIKSLEEINDEMTRMGNTATACAVFSTGNDEPTVDAGQNYNVPLNTPFVLTAVGSDPDGGLLTYSWEQYFNAATTVLSGEPTGAETNTPLFRSRPPTIDPQRYFPVLESVVNGVTAGDWESLPTTAQTLLFNVTVRDGVANGGYGCPQADQMAVTFVNTGTQFGVSSPNGGESIPAGAMQEITWNEAGTMTNGINCANIDILLSTDGGLTYPITLATATPNDGTLDVMMPATTTSTARIMVRCSDNIFFDISDTDFAIEDTEFTLDANLNVANVCPGVDEAMFTIDVESTQGYTGSIDLEAITGLPTGATAAFSTDPVVFTAGNVNTVQTIDVTIGNLAAAPFGDYAILIEGDDGTSTKMTTLSLNVGEGPVMLASPADNSELLVSDAGMVVFEFTTVPGRNRYQLDYTLFRGGVILGSANSVFSLGEDPGATPESFTVNMSGFASDGDEIRWTITASDIIGSNTTVISCERTFTFVNILPVTWLDFTAHPSGKTSVLNWSVEQDEFNTGFAVERSEINATNWTQVGYVHRYGSNGVARYAFTDEEVAAGNTYHYRLRQEDSDGSIAYSLIRTVAFDDAAGLTVSPNPTNNFVLLNAGTGTTENLRYTLYDPTGRIVAEGALAGGRAKLEMGRLPAAIYQVLVTGSAGYREVARVVKL